MTCICVYYFCVWVFDTCNVIAQKTKIDLIEPLLIYFTFIVTIMSHVSMCITNKLQINA